MNGDIIANNWALWAAVLPASLAAWSVAALLYRNSRHGQLRCRDRNYRLAQRELEQAGKTVRAAAGRLEKLAAKGDRIRPRHLQEAKEALADAEALQKIMDDKSQVEANHLRKLIYEEFPPDRHANMRAKYLPEDIRKDRPFSF